MLDWEFGDHHDTRSNAPARKQMRPRRSWKFWLLIGVVITIIGAAGIIGARRWLDDRREAMREDIRAVIEQEERARSFGLQDRASEFVAPSISRTWWMAYRSTFRPRREPAPVDVTLQDATFEDAGALVTVQVNGYTQLRYYRLAGQRWRRAQVPDTLWSGEREVLQIDDEIHLLFRPPDRDFAEELARDLPALLATMDTWPDGGPRLSQIEILANDLQPALLSSGDVRIEINSPMLVPYDGRLGGTAAVRFALASTLAWQNTSVSDDLQPLPGDRRILGAAKTITAFRWALSDEEQDRFRQEWRAHLEDDWASPFYTAMLPVDAEPSDEQVRAEFAALLTADYIADIGGEKALAGVLHGMTRSNSWDEVLQPAVDHTTITLEHAVKEHVSAPPTGSAPEPAALALPLTGQHTQ